MFHVVHQCEERFVAGLLLLDMKLPTVRLEHKQSVAEELLHRHASAALGGKGGALLPSLESSVMTSEPFSTTARASLAFWSSTWLEQATEPDVLASQRPTCAHCWYLPIGTPSRSGPGHLANPKHQDNKVGRPHLHRANQQSYPCRRSAKSGLPPRSCSRRCRRLAGSARPA